MTGDELSQARARLGLSQEKFAARLGVTGSAVWRWENGQRKVPEPISRFVQLLVTLEAPAPTTTTKKKAKPRKRGRR